MISCPFCDAEVNDDTANFCGACGADLSALQPSDDPWIGRVVGGRYAVVEHIGSGGMGEVYLAQHTQVGQKVAIKFLSRRLTGDPEIIRRFFNEARTIGRVNHPGAVTLNDFGQYEDGSLYIIMEYIEGQSLGDLVEERGRLALDLALNIVLQLCDVLDAAHGQDIIHRDLKPDNIMVSPSRKGRFHVKVLDFGIAKLLTEDSGLTQTGMVFGTPDFMSPEQATGEKTDGRADLYCAALILYYMLVGAPPFEATNPMQILHAQVNETPALPSIKNPEAHVPPALEAVIMKALNKRADERYGSISEFADALEELALAEGLPLSGAVAPLARGASRGTARARRDQQTTAPPESSREVAVHVDTRQESAEADDYDIDGLDAATSDDRSGPDTGEVTGVNDGFELDPSAYAIGEDIDGFAVRAARKSRPRTGIFLAGGAVVLLGLLLAVWAWSSWQPSDETETQADAGAGPSTPDVAVAAAEPDAPTPDLRPLADSAAQPPDPTPPRDTAVQDAARDAARKDAPKDLAPKDVAPKDPPPKDTAPKGAPKDAAPKDAAPKDAAPKDVAPKDAPPADPEKGTTPPRKLGDNTQSPATDPPATDPPATGSAADLLDSGPDSKKPGDKPGGKKPPRKATDKPGDKPADKPADKADGLPPRTID